MSILGVVNTLTFALHPHYSTHLWKNNVDSIQKAAYPPHSLPLIRLAFGQPPSPARGEGLSVPLSILLCKQVSASVRAFPLTGEGGTRSVTDEGEAKGLLYFTNTSANLHNSCIHCGKCYNPHAALPHTGNRRGVSVVDVLINFILAVSASVIAYYLCKWIDTWRKGR